MEPEITILIVQYRTLELTKLCLRLLRKYTRPGQARIVVIDNDSRDESLAYLKSLPWIELIERPALPGETPAQAHARALDVGLANTQTPFVMSMHTDTLVCAPDWLDFLLGQFQSNPKIGGVGSWKLEKVSPLKQCGKAIEDFVKLYMLAPLYGRKFGEPERKNHYYLRSHCAVYRTKLVKEFTSGFLDGDTAGKSLHHKLVAAGYEMKFLPSALLSRYVRHLNHATMILNPEIAGKKTGTPAARRKLNQELNELDYRAILADDSLDR